MKYILIAFVFFGLSCKKEKSCEECVGGALVKNATIVYAGPLEADGCGWLVKIDNTLAYHPDVLDTAFQHDQLAVKITFVVTTNNFICGIAAMSIPVIHVVHLEK
ncbi:MAG: hypothetical protein ABIO76_11580 [Ginsengibacter sp.]